MAGERREIWHLEVEVEDVSLDPAWSCSGRGAQGVQSARPVRQRSAVLEYRVEAFADRLGARLEALRRVGFDSTTGTTR